MIGDRLSRLWTIAASELTRGVGFFDARTTAILLATTALIGAMAPVAFSQGMDFEDGLYRVHVADGSPLAPAADAEPRIRRVVADQPRRALADDRIDAAVVGGTVLSRDTDKGRAAVGALQEAARDYTEARLGDEANRTAAFPVRVEVVYVERATIAVPTVGGGGGGGGGTGGNDSGGTDGGGDGGTVEGGDGGDGTTGDDTAPWQPGSWLVPQQTARNTPGGLSPPFPFRSLILAYLFLIPMNFVVQVYAGRVMGERIDRRGEPLLASPASPREIIVGRTLPYFGLLMVTAVGIALWLGGGWLSVAAIAPLALAFLAFEFVAAMFARSYRELTFLTVFISVLLTIYAFLPAVFTDVTPVAFISPITLVVVDLRGSAYTVAQALYATVPLTLVAGVLFVVGATLYREEDLFHQKPVPAKLVDALGRLVEGPASGVKLAVLSLPFVLVAELLIVTFLFAWPVSVGIVGGLVGVAFVEEVAKGLPAHAGVSRGRLAPDQAWRFGVLMGVGFFVAEKTFLLASLVGLFDVASGSAVFGTAGLPSAGVSPLVAGGLLVAPLALHVVTATVSALGAARGRDRFLVGLTAAMAIHAVYNAVVIAAVGGGVGP